MSNFTVLKWLFSKPLQFGIKKSMPCNYFKCAIKLVYCTLRPVENPPPYLKFKFFFCCVLTFFMMVSISVLKCVQCQFKLKNVGEFSLLIEVVSFHFGSQSLSFAFHQVRIVQ